MKNRQLFLNAILGLLLISTAIHIVDGRLAESSSSSRKNTEKLNTNQKNTVIFNNNNNKTSLCEIIHDDQLPNGCNCTEPSSYSLVIECDKKFNSSYINDTIGIKMDLNPCADDGSRLSLDITEKSHNIDYPITGIRAGETKNIPIPGLNLFVPKIGSIGLDAAVMIGGNPDHLTIKVGLNACVSVLDGHHEICASQLPGVNKILPFYILKGTYSFGNICNSTMATAYNTTTETKFATHDVFKNLKTNKNVTKTDVIDINKNDDTGVSIE